MKSFICKLLPITKRFKMLVVVFYLMAILTSLIGMSLIKFSSKEVGTAASTEKSDEDDIFLKESSLPTDRPAGPGTFEKLILDGRIFQKLKIDSVSPKRFFSNTTYPVSNYKLKHSTTLLHVRNTIGAPIRTHTTSTMKKLTNHPEGFQVSNNSKSFIISTAALRQTIRKERKSLSGQNMETHENAVINLNCLFPSFLTNTSNTFKLPSNFQVIFKNNEHVLACGKKLSMEPWRFLDQKYFGMIFLVKTAPRNIRYREMVRKTWGKIQSIRGMNFATIFLLGTTNSTKKNQLLSEENNKFGDILQCNYEDTYRNLPIKVILRP